MSDVTRAHRNSAHKRNVKSNEAIRMLNELKAIPVEQRRKLLIGTTESEWMQLLMASQREYGTAYSLWEDDALFFVKDVLGENTWSKPDQILESVTKNIRTVVPSCFSSGKSWSSSRLVLWKSMVHPPETVKVVTLAPKWSQVESIIWPEIRNAHARSGLPGTVDMTQLKIQSAAGKEVKVAWGITASPHNESAVQGIHCFDDQTEILTNQGWKFFEAVTGEEQVLTLRGDVAEWGPITKTWKHRYTGKMNLHDGERVNFCVTDNHRMLVRSTESTGVGRPRWTKEQIRKICARYEETQSSNQVAKEFGLSSPTVLRMVKGEVKAYQHIEEDGTSWKLEEFSKLKTSFTIRRTNKWAGSNPDSIRFTPPTGARGIQYDWTFSFKDWAEFLGWYVAEGSTTKSPKGFYTSRISQKPGRKYEQIATLLDRIGISYKRDKHDLVISNKAMGLWLGEHCGLGSENKKIPDSIKEASTEIIEIFLESYGYGDGCPHNGGWRYATASVQLADDLLEVLCKIGRGRKISPGHLKGSETVMTTTGRKFERRFDTWVIGNPMEPVESTVLSKNIQRIDYDGYVYCVSTPLETIMVRRKGRTMWSGNSPHVLVVVDEGGGVSPVIGGNLNALLTGGDSKLVVIGNVPSDEEGSWFEHISKEVGKKENSMSTEVIKISAYDTPLFTGEKVGRCMSCPENVPAHPITEHLIQPYQVADAITQHGEDSNWVKAKINVEWPSGGTNRVIPSSWVDAAREQESPTDVITIDSLGLPEERSKALVRRGAWVRLGIDVAADGGDEFAITRLVGDVPELVHNASGADNESATVVAGVCLEHIRRAEHLANALGTTAKVEVKVDGIGVGWGVASLLKSWGDEGLHGAIITAVIVSEKPKKEPDASTLRPRNQRAEMWLAMRAMLEPDAQSGQTGLRLNWMDEYACTQLSGPKKLTDSSGFTVIEKKSSMRDRNVPSPDRAESLILAIYSPAPLPRRGRILAI